MGKRGRPPRWKQFEAEFLARLDPERLAWIDREIGPGGAAALPDLHKLAHADLLLTFPGQPVGSGDGRKRQSLNDRRLIRALAWQLAMQISSRTIPRLDGNMRTAWYRFVEPFYLEKDLLDSDLGPELDPLEVLLEPDALGALEEAEAEFRFHLLEWLRAAAAGRPSALNRAARERYVINTMTEAFDDLYIEGILDFEEHFGFMDPGEAQYSVGENKAGKLLVTEKLGLTAMARRMGAKHEISWYVSQGEPSLLGLSFLGKKLKKRVSRVKVGSVTDYDPFGYRIGSSFPEKLASPGLFGPGQVQHTRLTGTQDLLKRLFTAAELRRARRDLGRYHKFKKKQIREWMQITGGLNGEEYGVHIDLANMQKLEALIEDWILDRL